MIKIIDFKEYERNGGGYKELLALLKDAFGERVEKGINFPIYFMDVEGLKKELQDMTTLVAVETDNNKLVGTASIKFCKDRKGERYAFNKHAGVASSAKHQGIGSKLERERIRIAKEAGVDYIRTGTSVNAKSSVKWHEKNGFKKVGLVAASGRDYYSYVYRYQINPNSRYNNSIYCFFQYLKWNIWVRLTKKKGGDPTIFGILFNIEK